MHTSEPKRKKRHVAIAQKLAQIEQNQCDFWIQHIRFIQNQLKNTDNKFFVDQCYIFTLNTYTHTKTYIIYIHTRKHYIYIHTYIKCTHTNIHYTHTIYIIYIYIYIYIYTHKHNIYTYKHNIYTHTLNIHYINICISDKTIISFSK